LKARKGRGAEGAEEAGVGFYIEGWEKTRGTRETKLIFSCLLPPASFLLPFMQLFSVKVFPQKLKG
jgi:hypothetical protein